MIILEMLKSLTTTNPKIFVIEKVHRFAIFAHPMVYHWNPGLDDENWGLIKLTNTKGL